MPAPSPRIASMDRARFLKLVAAKADAEQRLANAEAALKQFCRHYSTANRFGVVLTGEQVSRDMCRKEQG